jgi:hypothetical protein
LALLRSATSLEGRTEAPAPRSARYLSLAESIRRSDLTRRRFQSEKPKADAAKRLGDGSVGLVRHLPLEQVGQVSLKNVPECARGEHQGFAS